MNERYDQDERREQDRAVSAFAEERARDEPADEGLTTADMAGTEQRRSESRRSDEPQPTEPEAGQPAGGDEEAPAPLFAGDQAEQYRERWRAIQTNFVDDPRRAVEEADQLVARLMQDLAKTFADERAGLDSQWGSGEDVSTEDLRVALRRYRSFFDRLLSI